MKVDVLLAPTAVNRVCDRWRVYIVAAAAQQKPLDVQGRMVSAVCHPKLL